MKNIYKIGVLIALSANCLILNAQDDETPPTANQTIGVPNIGFKSPSAAAFDKFGDYPINLAYGTPNISIPIFSMACGDVSLPISIDYHAGGIRVADQGSWLGIGWNINAGGAITRQLNGLTDESANGFLSIAKDWYLDNNVQEGTGDAADYYKLKAAQSGGSLDTKPDIFSFNFPGYSGKFMFDQTGAIKLIPYTPINIKYTQGQILDKNGDVASYGINKFEIMLPDGTKYTFAQIETTDSYQGPHQNIGLYSSAWYLNKIEDPTHSDWINLEYQTILGPEVFYTPQIFTKKHQQIAGSYTTQGAVDQDAAYSHSEITEQRINKITSSNGIQVEFTGASATSRLIENIRILSNGIERRSGVLRYSKLTGTGSCTDTLRCRKKLDELQMDDKTWKFNYESIAEPALNSYNKDHWGYYNGANNTNPIPNVELGGETYGCGADRETNPDYLLFGMLKRITYPTGGYTDFIFGANQLSIVAEETGTIKYNFTQNSSHTKHHDSGQTTSTASYNWPGAYDWPCAEIPRWKPYFDIFIQVGTAPRPAGLDPGPQTYTHPPTFKMVGPKVNFTTTTIGTSGSYYDEYTDMYIDNVAFKDQIGSSDYYDGAINDYQVTLTTSTDARNYIKYTISREGYCESIPQAGDANIYVGGVRIQEIKNYEANGTLLTTTKYNYNKHERPIESSAELVNGLTSDVLDKTMYYTTGGGLASYLYVYDNPLNGFGSGSAVVVYNHVTETKVDGNGNTLGKTEYKFLNTKLPGQSVKNYPQVPYPDNTWHMGRKDSVKIYNSNNELVKYTNYDYELVSCGDIKAISVEKNKDFYWDGNISPGIDYTRFVSELYTVSSLRESIIYEENIDCFFNTSGQSTEIKTSKTYEYIPKLENPDWELIRRITTTESDGKKKINEFTYNHELQETAGFQDHPLKTPGTIRERRTYIDDNTGINKLVEAQAIHYRFNKPSKVYSWIGSTPDNNFIPISLDFEYNMFLDDGYETIPSVEVAFDGNDPVQYNKKNDIKVAIYWAYNKSFPVINAENCTYAELELALNNAITNGKLKIYETTYNNMNDFMENLGILDHDYKITGWINFISYFQSQLPNAMVTIYTYSPLFGMTSQTDPNGKTTYYEYDSFGRLYRIKDHNGNILKQNTYHYANQ